MSLQEANQPQDEVSLRAFWLVMAAALLVAPAAVALVFWLIGLHW